ncbi:MAG: MaoC/PaaZ C-terminal domain-containing protein [Candidatus Dormibacteria bacterium]
MAGRELSTDRELSASPRMLPLFARAGLAMVPGASRLPFVGGGGGEVPAQALALSVDTDRDRLAAYDRVCGFPVSDTVPLTWPHMLAFPVHLALISSGDFPLPAIGLVHITNRIVSHRSISAGETLDLRVWAGPLTAHPRGTQFAIHTEARAGGELVWEEISVNLRRGRPPAHAGDTDSPTAVDPPFSEDLPMSATWRLPGDLGRRYGAVSGDLNPIHVHPLSARLFGFPSAIAHGMWTAARCLAAMHPLRHDAVTVEVAFKRPILLPATVAFAESRQSDELRFGVRDARRDTPHLDGLITFGA